MTASSCKELIVGPETTDLHVNCGGLCLGAGGLLGVEGGLGVSGPGDGLSRTRQGLKWGEGRGRVSLWQV